MDNIFLYIFLVCIVVLFGCVLYDTMKCKHEWEEVVRNSVTVVYRCKKCGKEKRYTL